MPDFSPDTLERDIAAILGAAGRASEREGAGRGQRLAIALAVLATLSLTALHRMPGPGLERGPLAAMLSSVEQPVASAFSASPTLPLPQPAELTPFRAAPRAILAGGAVATSKAPAGPRPIASPRQRAPQTEVASLSPRESPPREQPTRERLTLAQAMPSEEERENEGIINTAGLARIDVRAARLEAVDAIRTLRLR